MCIRDSAGIAVRLLKYLVNDYYEEFFHTVRDWVSSKLRVLARGNGARESLAGLRDLYTSHVVPDEMMILWNNGCGSLSHEVGMGVDPNEDSRLQLTPPPRGPAHSGATPASNS